MSESFFGTHCRLWIDSVQELAISLTNECKWMIRYGYTWRWMTQFEHNHRATITRMWANARPNVMVALPNIGGALCSTPQSLADAHYWSAVVTLPICESRWNLQGCPKLANRSQPLVGRNSPGYEDMWRRYRCLTCLFRLSIYALAAKIQPEKVVRWCQNVDFCDLCFERARAAHFRHAF